MCLSDKDLSVVGTFGSRFVNILHKVWLFFFFFTPILNKVPEVLQKGSVCVSVSSAMSK